MPKILVCLADARERKTVRAALEAKKYTVSEMEPPARGESPKAVAERIRGEDAAVAVMDYLDDDAASVKTMQAASDASARTRFVFLLSRDVPRSHLFMAINEGAAAVLERPLNLDALANYVARAASGPSRFRADLDREAEAARELEALEREAASLRMQLASHRKLISHLMATPAAKQSRTALVVSDSAYQRDYLKSLMQHHGFRVLLAANPADGLKTALTHKPRVVVSDLEMDGQNGIEFCRELKIVHKFVPCFFVICTANSDRVEEAMAPGNGVDGCVIKPGNESGNQELIAAAGMGLLL